MRRSALKEFWQKLNSNGGFFPPGRWVTDLLVIDNFGMLVCMALSSPALSFRLGHIRRIIKHGEMASFSTCCCIRHIADV